MILWSPSGWAFSSALRKSKRWTNSLSIYLKLRRRGMSTTKQIVQPTTNSSLMTRFAFPPGMVFQHPCKMKCMIKTSTIATCTMKNGVNFCPPWREKIIKSELQIKSKDLHPLRMIRPTLTSMRDLRLLVIRRPWVVSWYPTIIRVRKPSIINILSVTTCCSRRLEWLIASINSIYQKNALVAGTNSNP